MRTGHCISAISAEEHLVEEDAEPAWDQAPAQPLAQAPAVPAIQPQTQDGDSNGATPGGERPERPVPPVAATNGVAAPTNGSAVAQRTESAMPVRKRLSLRIVESGEVDRDRQLLDRVVRELLEHGGHDDVVLQIATGGRLVSMEWPHLTVAATEELTQTLTGLLGDSGVVSLES